MSLAIKKQSEVAKGAWDFITNNLNYSTDKLQFYKENIYRLNSSPYPIHGFLPTREATDIVFEISEKLVVYFNSNPISLKYGEKGITAYGYCYEKPPVGEPTASNEKSAVSMKKVYTLKGSIPLEFTAVDEALLSGLFNNTTIVASTEYESIAIILEEASAYLYGIKSLDKTVKQIQNRIETRINE